MAETRTPREIVRAAYEAMKVEEKAVYQDGDWLHWCLGDHTGAESVLPSLRVVVDALTRFREHATAAAAASAKLEPADREAREWAYAVRSFCRVHEEIVADCAKRGWSV